MQHAFAQQEPTRDDIVTLAALHSKILFQQLHAQSSSSIQPSSQKKLRDFSLAETAFFTGLREADIQALLRQQPDAAIRRVFDADEFDALREAFDANSNGRQRVTKARRGGEKLQVISVVNFKGGSCKTTTAAHLGQHLALRGYRVLAIDLDPQASLTALHGIQPELNPEGTSLYAAINYEAPVPVANVIRKTYFPNLDIIPAHLELMAFEHSTPHVMKDAPEVGGRFFLRIEAVLDQVDHRYDVVVFDCPPQLGFLSMSALCASNSVLVPVHPQMLDTLSMGQFLDMSSQLLGVLRERGASLELDWFRYLLTRHEPNDVPQQEIAGLLRGCFGDYVMKSPMVKSTAFSDAGLSKQTLYEIEGASFSRGTYNRAMESLIGVNNEIEHLIYKAWGRI